MTSLIHGRGNASPRKSVGARQTGEAGADDADAWRIASRRGEDRPRRRDRSERTGDSCLPHHLYPLAASPVREFLLAYKRDALICGKSPSFAKARNAQRAMN